jgi:hypothetical protein
LRASIIADISISLKVVKLAFVFCDSLRRRAIVYLILFIGTRVSTRPPEISDGAFLLTTVVTPDLVEAAGAAAGVAGAATGAGSGA